jgi:hypothetical protein
MYNAAGSQRHYGAVGTLRRAAPPVVICVPGESVIASTSSSQDFASPIAVEHLADQPTTRHRAAVCSEPEADRPAPHRPRQGWSVPRRLLSEPRSPGENRCGQEPEATETSSGTELSESVSHNRRFCERGRSRREHPDPRARRVRAPAGQRVEPAS